MSLDVGAVTCSRPNPPVVVALTIGTTPILQARLREC